LPFTSADDRLGDEGTNATDSLSGVQVREVAFRALQRAILRTTDAKRQVRLERGDVAGAIGRVASKKDAGCGFNAGQQ
jgi:hypothetical protein